MADNPKYFVTVSPKRGGVPRGGTTGQVLKKQGAEDWNVDWENESGNITVNQNKLLGRGASSGTGTAEEITLGTNLSLIGTTLNATGGSDVTAGTGIDISSGVVSVSTGVITDQISDSAPTIDDVMLTYDPVADGLRQVTLGDLGNNLEIDKIVDPVTGWAAQFDTSGLSSNRSITIPGIAGSSTVIDTLRSPGTFFTGISSGVTQYGYYDISTIPQLTSDTNNYNPSSSTYYFQISSDGSRNLTGLVGTSTAGETHIIICTSNTVVLTNEDAGSIAANRFHTSTGSSISLASGQMAYLYYNGTLNRWIVTALGGGSSSVAWGSITGTLSSQTDLNTALAGKAANGANTDITSILVNQTGLNSKDGSGSFHLGWKNAETLTANRNFNVVTGDASRTLTFGGDITTAGAFATSGANSLTLTTTGTTNATLPSGSTTLLASGGALGTPSSGTLTNCTGLPVAGITSSTSTALGVGSLEVGNASDTTLSRSAAGQLAMEGVDIISTSNTKTLTNKTLTSPVFTGLTSGTQQALVAVTSGGVLEVGSVKRAIGSSTSGTAGTDLATITASASHQLVCINGFSNQASAASTQILCTITYSDSTTTSDTTGASSTQTMQVNDAGILRSSGTATANSAKKITSVSFTTAGTGTGARLASVSAVEVPQ